MTVKPFIRWAGGKQNIVEDIINNFPKKSDINNYFEPFVGAGSVFFATSFKRSYLSDINPQLINSYFNLKSDFKKVDLLLQKYYKAFALDPLYYYELRRLFNQDRNKFNHIQASRFIFLIQTNYNGIFRLNKKGEYNVPVGKKKPVIPDFTHLMQISDKLQNAELKCSDFKSILNQTSYKDFVYLDPPYPPLDWKNPQNQYTIDKFKLEDHKTVAGFANKLSQKGCFVMISYPNMSIIKNMYRNWNVLEINAFRSISCKKERKIISEILIKNY